MSINNTLLSHLYLFFFIIYLLLLWIGKVTFSKLYKRFYARLFVNILGNICINFFYSGVTGYKGKEMIFKKMINTIFLVPLLPWKCRKKEKIIEKVNTNLLKWINRSECLLWQQNQRVVPRWQMYIFLCINIFTLKIIYNWKIITKRWFWGHSFSLAQTDVCLYSNEITELSM